MRIPLLWGAVLSTSLPVPAQLWLGEPPSAPIVSAKTPVQAKSLAITVTGGFSVDTASREQVRSFYNAVYLAANGVAMNSSAAIPICQPGTNAPGFVNAVLNRINWFRAMAGLPAAVTFDAGEIVKCQQAALIMAANTNLAHTGIPPTWHCFSVDGTNAAANANLALGYTGPDAITGYIWDFGLDNAPVGHRRWILYPQTQVMATGDIRSTNGYSAANATWVFDANFGGPRPATRTPFVAWPPAGYVPYPVVFPRWSLALSNADLSMATVSMKSNGVSLAVSVESYALNYGENTLVWHPAALATDSPTNHFPFSGTDTVYSVTVSNILIGGLGSTNSFSYTVTVFDPARPGPDAVPTLINGPNQATVNADNPYTCAARPDPQVTGYEWLVAQTNNGNFLDGAEGSLTNFTVTVSPGYAVITNSAVSGQTGSHCFYLAMPKAESQKLQVNSWFLPRTNSQVSFKSLLGYATSNQVARLQMTTNDGLFWQDLFTLRGTNGLMEPAWVTHICSLTNFADVPVRLRWAYDFDEAGNGTYYTNVLTNPPVGWFLDNLTVTNILGLVPQQTNATVNTNFTFVPAAPTNYVLRARGILYGEFPLDWGPIKLVRATSAPPVIVMMEPSVSNSQVRLPFLVSGGPAATFRLLQVNQLGAAWTTNSTATLTTNVAGRSFTFTTTNGPAARFYRVKTP